VAVRPVLRFPHPALKRVAAPLPEGGSEEAERAAGDLLDTMRSFGHCVGLAAPQLDDAVRLVAVDVSEHPKATTAHGLLVLANPRVVGADGAEVAREGCLSIPDLTANVRRANSVVIEAETPVGEPVEVESEGFEARCLLHEIDHLDGILFLDRVDSLARDVFRRRSYR
jgi:peptide deformylase